MSDEQSGKLEQFLAVDLPLAIDNLQYQLQDNFFDGRSFSLEQLVLLSLRLDQLKADGMDAFMSIRENGDRISAGVSEFDVFRMVG